MNALLNLCWEIEKLPAGEQQTKVSELANGIRLRQVEDILMEQGSFSFALTAIKAGRKVARKGWNAGGQWVVLQKGYPKGINLDTRTAEATRLPLGSLQRFAPYFMLYTAQEIFCPWVPSISDILANDWEVLDG